jgi:hypothetical protein
VKRPSFQFYPADWRKDANLRRCSPAARGVWMDVLCVLHDSEEYGIVRWPLKEIASAAGASIVQLRELAEKRVLKGCDQGPCEPLVFTPRHGRKLGEPVILIAEQDGPLWFSARFVRDEYVRTIRGEASRFGDGKGDASKPAPNPPFGDGSSTATSSSPSGNTDSVPDGTGADAPAVRPGVTAQDQVFAIGVTLLTAADVSDRNARSFLAAQCKAHGPERVVEALRTCAAERPVQPVPRIVEILGRPDARQKPNAQEALEAANRAVAARFLENDRASQ